MKKDNYFKLMSETTQITKPLIWNYLESIEDDKLRRTLLFYPQKRFEKQKLFLRPLLIRLSYEAAGGKNWKDIAPIYAAYELLNISTYQSNLSFDKKQGITTPDKINNQFIASMITRELSQKLVYERLHNASHLNEVLNSLNNINCHIYEGQFYDLNILHMNNWKNFETMHEFMDAYISKCLCLSGIFFEECAYIGAVLGNNNEVAEQLRKFGRNFGIGLHIVNDIANFIPVLTSSESKYAEFADLKNFRLTLPIYYLLRYGNEYNKNKFLKLWNSKSHSISKYSEMARIVINDDAILYARRIAKIFMKKAKQNLLHLGKKETTACLATMASVLKTNKYFKALSYLQDSKTKFNIESIKVMETIKYEYNKN